MYNEKVGATEHPLWEVSDVGDILMRKPQFCETSGENCFDWMINSYFSIDKHLYNNLFTDEEKDDMKERIGTTLSMLLMDPSMMEIKHGLDRKAEFMETG